MRVTSKLHQLLPLGCLAAFATLTPACQREQWVVTISTDARVPQFGDRLSVDVLDAKGSLVCASCTHLFEVGDPRAFPVSFGIQPSETDPGAELQVRARLYRADHAGRETKQPETYIDAVGRLPELGGVASAYLKLSMECFQVPSQIHEDGTIYTCDRWSGSLGPVPVLTEPPRLEEMLQPDSWLEGRERACPEAANRMEPDMVCIPGGSFVRGGTRYLGAPARKDATFSAYPEALVVLDPFLIDARELQVAEFYKLKEAHPMELAGVNPLLSSENSTCTLKGTAVDATNLLPLNCVSHQAAEQICRVAGKRLLTEAEWEFAAGNQLLETTFPWGNDEDVCSHAMVARGPTIVADCLYGKNVAPSSFGLEVGGHPDDVTQLGVHDLAGSLSEWVADMELPYARPCFGRLPLLRNWVRNPVCLPENDSLIDIHPPTWITRGAAWNTIPANASAIQRWGAKDIRDRKNWKEYDSIGVRCGKSLPAAR